MLSHGSGLLLAPASRRHPRQPHSVPGVAASTQLCPCRVPASLRARRQASVSFHVLRPCLSFPSASFGGGLPLPAAWGGGLPGGGEEGLVHPQLGQGVLGVPGPTGISCLSSQPGSPHRQPFGGTTTNPPQCCQGTILLFLTITRETRGGGEGPFPWRLRRHPSCLPSGTRARGDAWGTHGVSSLSSPRYVWHHRLHAAAFWGGGLSTPPPPPLTPRTSLDALPPFFFWGGGG